MRESSNAEALRAWLKESFAGAEWEDDDSPVVFYGTPIEQLLEAVIDWHDRHLSDALKRLEYSTETIRDFRENRFDLASAVEGPAVPVGCTATIDPANRHPAARDIDHMLLIDGFELLRAARAFAGRAMFTNTRRCLQLVARHWSIFHEKERPAILGANAGRASGKARRKKRAEKLDAAARACGQLRKKNEYTMRGPKKHEIEEAAGLLKGSLRKISLREIRTRTDELRICEGSDQ